MSSDHLEKLIHDVHWTVPEAIFEAAPELRTVLGPNGPLEEQADFLFEAMSRLRNGVRCLIPTVHTAWEPAYAELIQIHERDSDRAIPELHFDPYECDAYGLLAVMRVPRSKLPGPAPLTFNLYSVAQAPALFGGLQRLTDGQPLISINGDRTAMRTVVEIVWRKARHVVCVGLTRLWNP